MKTKRKASKSGKHSISSIKARPKYYFHADEDFREDRDWGKSKTQAENYPGNQL